MVTQNSSGHYANMRKRFVQNGLKGFLDYEVIEFYKNESGTATLDSDLVFVNNDIRD